MNIEDMLTREEGRVPYAYPDSEGYLTIGIGRLIDKRKGGGLSDDEIDLLFANDVKAKAAEVRAHIPWFDTLNEPRQAVLIGMAFQMGIGGLMGFPHFLAATRDQRWPQAEGELLASKWHQQTPERSARMARQIATGEWQ